MGLQFETVNISMVRKRYFFSFEDFQGLSDVELDSKIEAQSLSFGESIGAWHAATCLASARIYENLRVRAPALFRDFADMSALSVRQTEVLIGNLAHYLSLRLSRSLAQLELVENEDGVDESVFRRTSEMKLFRPTNSKEAFRLLNSESFTKLIDLCALKISSNYRHDIILQIRERHDMGSIETQKSIGERTYLMLQNVLRKKSSKNSISITSSYLGRLQESVLSLLLVQAPSLVEIRPQLKRSMTKAGSFTLKSEANEGDVALFLLSLLIPLSLSEDFTKTLARAHSLGFAKAPKTVFTSNAFDSDDEFKAHLANSLHNATYIVGQHGVGYGVAKTRDICPELNAADLFLSWGWKSEISHVYPFGQLKPKLRKVNPSRLEEVTLFLRPEVFSFLLFADMREPNISYFQKVIELASELDRLEIKTSLRIHHATSRKYIQFIENSISGLHHVSIADKRLPIRKLVSKGVGVVFTYDSTSMLEMGTAQIPFFSFMPDGLNLIRPEFQSNYEALRTAGILSEHPREAARMICSWIGSYPAGVDKTEALKAFISGIAHEPPRKLWKLRKILLNPSLVDHQNS